MTPRRCAAPPRPFPDLRARDAGFTLVEIMVVIVILGVLATLAVQNVVDEADRARETKASADVRVLADAVRLFRIDHGRLPGSLAALTVPDARGRRPLEELPRDPWGFEYVLDPGTGAAVADWDVCSPGPDGSHGTEDDVRARAGR